MSSHFQPKSLLFYGIMIGLVSLLFRLTSAYGEAHLKAPPNINGRYLINEALVECLAGDNPTGETAPSRLILVIQQSGIYLHGALALVNAEAEGIRAAQGEAPGEERLLLTGRWDKQTLTLSGTTELANCQLTAQDGGAANAAIPVNIAGQLTGSPINRLQGQITLGSTPLQFTAEREVIETQAEGH